MKTRSEIETMVRDRYARAAKGVDGCCSTESSSTCCGDPISSDLYGSDQLDSIPENAVAASLGCGNPTFLADLRPGQTVLDLGSGGGIDVLLSARRVGPDGWAYGLDMTDEMLELARRNQAEAGVENVTFLKGSIEEIPLPDASVDVIISNCVVNLAADKQRVLAEAYRVLKPGGRFAVSDIVRRGDVPEEIRQSVEMWAGGIAGALEIDEYLSLLERAGFEEASAEITREYNTRDFGSIIKGTAVGSVDPAEVDGKYASAFIRAKKA